MISVLITYDQFDYEWSARISVYTKNILLSVIDRVLTRTTVLSISRKILREKSLARRSLVYIFSTNWCPFLKITVCHVLRTWSPSRDQWTIESYKSLLSSNFLNWSVNTHNEWCWKFLSTHRIEERIDMNS